MKKLLALTLGLLMLISVFSGCASISQDDEIKGAIIPIYVSSKINTIDPMYAYLDDAGAKILGLLYEGLFRINADGEVENALCKSYKTGTNRDGDFYMEITLNETHWSDGRSVTSDDFVYAWKRIIEPSSSSEAAAMLYDIKNAHACKLGDASIDDLGVVSSEPQVLTITFERKIDVDTFKEYLASPALVPLREDRAARLENWGSSYVTAVTNGPFFTKIFTPEEKTMIIERSNFYYRDLESDTQKLDVYVTPYRFVIYFCSPEEALKKYEEGKIVYMSDLPLDSRSSYSKKVTKNETLSTATFYLNTTKAPFDNVNVRKALSMALDRKEIVKLVTYATPAEGFIPSKVFNTTKGTSFRKEGGSLISSKGDLDGAKKLLKDAGVTETSFTLSIRNDPTSKAVADYAVGVWEKLGFDVTIETLGYESDEVIKDELGYDLWYDLFAKAYYEKDFDVMLVDAFASSTDAFSTLAPFAVPFSGASIDLASGDYSEKPGVTGYSSEKYDAKITEAYKTTDRAKRAKILHEAEKLLISDMPIIPLFVYQDAYVSAKGFSDFGMNYFTDLDFKEAELDDYENYKEFKDVYEAKDTAAPAVPVVTLPPETETKKVDAADTTADTTAGDAITGPVDPMAAVDTTETGEPVSDPLK